MIVTDAWWPQINGVVRTLTELKVALERLGHTVSLVEPGGFRTVAMPGYSEIRLAINPKRKVGRLIEDLRPRSIHLATEGPLGLAARRHCLRRGYPFTSAYHSRFPEYIRKRLPIPLSLSYAWLRRFHASSRAVLVGSKSVAQILRQRGFDNLRLWSRGVDVEVFHPDCRSPGVSASDRSGGPFGCEALGKDFVRPVYLYVGRLAVEKNVEDFLELDLKGSKWVVGDGPLLPELKKRYPQARFVGYKHGKELARYYATADVLVFPSKTDTFGLVILEALACGTPVAAFPAPGPLDILTGSEVDCLDDDLRRSVRRALSISSERCREFARRFSWTEVAQQFLSCTLEPPVRHGGD